VHALNSVKTRSLSATVLGDFRMSEDLDELFVSDRVL